MEGKTGVCFKNLDNMCRFGESCKYRHISKDEYAREKREKMAKAAFDRAQVNMARRQVKEEKPVVAVNAFEVLARQQPKRSAPIPVPQRKVVQPVKQEFPPLPVSKRVEKSPTAEQKAVWARVEARRRLEIENRRKAEEEAKEARRKAEEEAQVREMENRKLWTIDMEELEEGIRKAICERSRYKELECKRGVECRMRGCGYWHTREEKDMVSSMWQGVKDSVMNEQRQKRMKDREFEELYTRAKKEFVNDLVPAVSASAPPVQAIWSQIAARKPEPVAEVQQKKGGMVELTFNNVAAVVQQHKVTMMRDEDWDSGSEEERAPLVMEKRVVSAWGDMEDDEVVWED